MELKLIDTIENTTIQWINENDKFLDQIADEMDAAGISHHDAFNRESKLMNKLVEIACKEITRYDSDFEYIDTQVRSYVANRMHDLQWDDSNSHYLRSFLAFQ